MMGPQQALIGLDGPRGGMGSQGVPCCGCCCGADAPNPDDTGFLWLRSDRNRPEFLTVDDELRSSLWINQFPPDLDVSPQDNAGFPAPVGQWPVWTPSVQNGLGGMLWSNAAFTHMMKVFPNGTFNQPTADGAPLQVLAVVRPFTTDLNGNNVITFRLNNDDLEFGIRKKHFDQDYYIPISTAQDAHGCVVLYHDYSNVPLLMEWVYFGHDIVPEWYINGVKQTIIDAQLNAYSGVSGFSVGYCNAVFNEVFDGYIHEILGYHGTSASTRLAARQYLNNKWRVF